MALPTIRTVALPMQEAAPVPSVTVWVDIPVTAMIPAEWELVADTPVIMVTAWTMPKKI